MYDEEQQDESSEPSHITGIPFTSFIAHGHLVSCAPFLTVLQLESICLHDMNDKPDEQPDLQYPGHYRSAQEIGRHIEHLAAIHGPYTGIDANMHYQKKDQEYPCETHDELFADGRSEEFRPF